MPPLDKTTGERIIVGMTNTKQNFEIGVTVTNERGAWVRLMAASHTSGMYPVFYFEHWSPTFDPELTSAESAPNRNRSFVERQMRVWLKKR